MASRRASPSKAVKVASAPKPDTALARALAEKNTVVAIVLGEGPVADAAEARARQVAQDALFSQVRVERSTELPETVTLPAGSGTPRTVVLDFERKVSATLGDAGASRFSDLSDAFLAALAGEQP